MPQNKNLWMLCDTNEVSRAKLGTLVTQHYGTSEASTANVKECSAAE